MQSRLQSPIWIFLDVDLGIDCLEQCSLNCISGLTRAAKYGIAEKTLMTEIHKVYGLS